MCGGRGEGWNGDGKGGKKGVVGGGRASYPGPLLQVLSCDMEV